MSKIYDLSIWFKLVRGYVNFTFKRYYGEFIITGRENIPQKSPVIFAPNHINALMDALVVHSVASQNMPVIFLARSDIFKNKTAAKFLYFAKIMPAFRMRDGIENLGKNSEIFDQCVEVLLNNKAIGIMPEGNQEIERKVRPLVKGIFRIAFGAQQKIQNQNGVKIVPIGIDYGDLIKSNKHIIINIGKSIEVADYMTSYIDNQALTTNELKDKLANELRNLTVNLDSVEYYNCFEIAVEVANKAVLKELNLTDNTYNRFVARQQLAKRLVAMEATDIEKIKRLDLLCSDYSNILKKIRLKDSVFEFNNVKFSNLIAEGFLLVITLPLLITGFLLNVFPFFTPVIMRKYFIKPEFSGFFSTLQFVLGIITFPIFYLIQTLLFGLFVFGSWGAIFLFILAQYPLGKLSLLIYKKVKKLIGKIQYLRLKKKNSADLIEVLIIRNQIINLISNDK